MNIAFFGSSLLSAYWNGAATYYRGIIRALHARGHHITFYEPDAYERQSHCDLAAPSWAKVVVFPNSEAAALRAVEDTRQADLIIKASGVGVFDDLLEHAVLEMQSGAQLVAFWDVDAPATLERLHSNPDDPFASLIPRYDMIFTYGGGRPVADDYLGFGARSCVPIYNALDPSTHFPTAPSARFTSDLSFLGNRLPDREARVEEFFFSTAKALPAKGFLIGGSGWDAGELPPNVRYAGHVLTTDHNEFNSSAAAVLNISRASMARYGFSPATRVFEAAGAGACLITDYWEGIGEFFEPGREILVARDGAEVAELMARMTADSAAAIGRRAYQRVLSDHTYSQRAVLFEETLDAQLIP